MADFAIAQSSRPVTWSFAVKNTRDPTGVKELGEDQPAPTAISWTMPVVLVPSVAHSSRPWASSYALSSTRPLTAPRSLANAGAGMTSMRGSAVTPSLFHSSHVCAPCARNTRVSFTVARPPPPHRAGAGTMPSRISAVPASVPSVLHSANGLEVLKKTTPLTPMSGAAPDEPGPGVTSLTSTVPPSVPSLFQSSLPKSEWNALKKSVPLTLVRCGGSGVDVLDEHGALLGPVALPELPARLRVA